LPALLVDGLTAHKTVQLRAGLLAAPVFSTRDGNHLMRSNVLRALRAIIQRANKAGGDIALQIPTKLRFHDLRHTHASLLLREGQSLRAVSQRLGHSNPALTLKVYAHCLLSDDAQLAEGLNRMMA
jgi:integrase